MSTLQNRPRTALVVIDVQRDVVATAHNRDSVIANIVRLVERARSEQIPVVWNRLYRCPCAASRS